MSFVTGKTIMLRYFTLAATLASVGCTSTIVQTPQQMSEAVINVVKVDPKTDPNPQTLAFDQTACINKARLEYPIVHIDEGGIMASNMLLGAAGGAGSGAAAAAGTGHAGQAAGINALGGAAQGLQSGLDQIKNTYVMQTYQQALHYGSCLQEHGHVVYGGSEADLARARSEDLARATSGVGSPQVGPASALLASPNSLQMARSTLLGVWRGSYACGQGETGVELSFTDISDDGTVMGTFTFFNLPGHSNAGDGEYSLVGHINSSEQQLYFDPGAWIRQPPGYAAVGFSTPVPLPGIHNMAGTITYPGCSQIYAAKAAN